MSKHATDLPDPAGAAIQAAAKAVPAAPAHAAASPLAASLVAAAGAWIDSQGGGEGHFPLPMDGVHAMRAFQRFPANHRIYRPSLCVVLQGGKQIAFGDELLSYGVMQCLIVSMDLPACGGIVEASAGAPFIGVNIEFDADAMREVLEQLDHPPAPPAAEGASLFVAAVDAPLAECVLRLFRIAQTPQAVPILAPSVMREIYYWLLTGPYGGEIRRQMLPDTHADRIVRAIRLLRDNFARTVRVEQLADEAMMSPSSFHQHFKALTSMTPLQFQKQLRLLEARRLMVAEALSVSAAAYQVGYESASQFSREYSRAFGDAPKRNVMGLRAEMV